MTAPRTPRYLVELLPVAFLPGLHTVLALLRSFFVPFVLTAHLLPVVCFYSLLTSSIRPWMRRVLKRFTLRLPPPSNRNESLCYRRDDTTHLRLRAIFLGWCFKHVTGA